MDSREMFQHFIEIKAMLQKLLRLIEGEQEEEQEENENGQGKYEIKEK